VAPPIHIGSVFLALLALAVQLAVGATVPQPQLAALDRIAAICHAGTTPDEAPPAAPHHTPDCLLCPLCATLAGPSLGLAGSGPVLPPPGVTVIARAALPPPATAPPARQGTTAQPRAPPHILA